VVVGKIGDDLRMDYMAVGDTTNLAARLQQVARPRNVIISEATEPLTNSRRPHTSALRLDSHVRRAGSACIPPPSE